MDKNFGIIYQKLTGLFHSSQSNASTIKESDRNSNVVQSNSSEDHLSATNQSYSDPQENSSNILHKTFLKMNDKQPRNSNGRIHSRMMNKNQAQDFVPGMDEAEFRRRGKEMIDYIADYLSHINDRRVTPEVEPGYLRPMLPKNAPEKGELWDDIMRDVEQSIMPGITHWQHSRFHAYFPAGNSYPSILGEMLSAGLGIVGFSWAASPACTELETIMLDWIGRMIGLPSVFLPFDPSRDNHESDDDDDDDELLPDSEEDTCENDAQVGVVNGNSEHVEKKTIHIGGGVLLGSASECVLVAMLAARTKKITSKRQSDPSMEDGQILARLVCYTSKLAHSCVEKAGLIAMVRVRQLAVDEHFSLRGKTLEEAIRADKEKGLIPFFVSGTLGTTSCCSYDNFAEIGQICQREKLWFHVDGAYGGSALICPEYRYLMNGLEYADSFNTNPNKWLLINFDCSCFWVRDKYALINAMSVDPLYLQHKHAQKAVDYRHWGVALSRRFRSLKLWFTIRSYGIDGLRHYIREHCRLAKVFEQLVKADSRFEIIGDVTLGLVCFRLKGSNKLSQKLLLSLNDSGLIHMVPSMVNDIYIIRFAVCAKYATEDDMTTAFEIIKNHADSILTEHRAQRSSARQSASNDSLDLAMKTNSNELEINSPEETVNEKEIPETTIPPRNFPSTKVRSNTITTITPHHRVTFEKPLSSLSKEKRSKPMFVRMVSDAKLYSPKRTTNHLSRQSSLATPRARKRIQSDSGNHTARSSSERYLSRTVSILETVNSDEGEPEDNNKS